MTIGLVGQGQITTFTSPVNGTSPIDANVVRGNDNTTKTAFNNHDLNATIHFQSSLNVSRPPAGVPGRKWLDTDTRRVYYDDGITWNEIGYISTSGSGTGIPGPVTVTGGGITVVGGGVTADGDISAGGNVIAHTLFIADGTSAQNRGLVARTTNVTRWFVGANAAAETGSNAGSDLSIAAYSDAGALLREPFVVKRDTGNITVNGPILANEGLTVNGTINGNGRITIVTNETANNPAVFQNSHATGYGLSTIGGAGSNYSLNVAKNDGALLFRVVETGSLIGTKFVVGLDPGGAGMLRVGGDINVGSAVRTSGGAHMLSYDAPTTTVAVGSGNPDALDLYGGGLRRMRFGTDGSVTIGTTTGGGGILTLGAQTPSANAVSAILLTASNTQYNWRIGHNWTVVGGLEFAPSLGAGSTSFGAPALSVQPSGAVTVGVDPGGAGLFKVGGASRLKGQVLIDMTLALDYGLQMVNDSPTGYGFYCRGGGTNTIANFADYTGNARFYIDYPSTAAYTSVTVYCVDTASLARVRTGPAGSGPGGVGRALYV